MCANKINIVTKSVFTKWLANLFALHLFTPFKTSIMQTIYQASTLLALVYSVIVTIKLHYADIKIRQMDTIRRGMSEIRDKQDAILRTRYLTM